MNEPPHPASSQLSYSPDFTEFSRVLSRLGVMSGPSECHGLITGYLCGKRGFDAPEEFYSILDLPPSSLAEAGQDTTALEDLASEIFRQLESEDCTFHPLLPEEIEPLEARIAALGDWCQGFLLGLGLSGFREIPKRASESHEFIQDLTAFTRAGVSPGASEQEDERAFAEIIEYIRMGALLLREEALYGASKSRGEF